MPGATPVWPTVEIAKMKESDRAMLLPTPYQLTIMTTGWCNARCDHCLADAGPERSNSLSYEQIRTCVERIHKEYPLKVVIFTGGECTILGDHLLDAVAHANSYGIVTRVVTNAGWATSEATARKRLVELREAGLQEINFSADDFHEEYVAAERITNAWRAAKGLGFLAVVVVNTTGAQSKLTPELLRSRLGEDVPHIVFNGSSAQDLPSPSADGTIYFLSEGQLCRLGRAGRLLSDNHFVMKRIDQLNAPCCQLLINPTITSGYHLAACCSGASFENSAVDLGDLSAEDPIELLRRADQDLILNAIALFGPVALLKLIHETAPEIGFPDRYSSMCEVCRLICGTPDALDTLRNVQEILAEKVLAARGEQHCEMQTN